MVLIGGVPLRSLGTTPISGKNALGVKKAILGALGAFRGLLGVQRIFLGMQNPILGMASHDLCNAKTIVLGATPGAIPGLDGNPHERFSFAHALSERFFKNWGGSCAPESHVLLQSGLPLYLTDMSVGNNVPREDIAPCRNSAMMTDKASREQTSRKDSSTTSRLI